MGDRGTDSGLADDDIRIRGHRIGIESVLYEYLYRSQTPDEIAHRYWECMDFFESARVEPSAV